MTASGGGNRRWLSWQLMSAMAELQTDDCQPKFSNSPESVLIMNPTKFCIKQRNIFTVR
jgi:hypothetical protein